MMKNLTLNHRLLSAVLSFSVLTTVLPLSLLPERVHAQNQAPAASQQAAAKPEKKRRVKRSATMRPMIYKKLEKGRELADNKQYDDAMKAIAALDKIKRNSYEKAMTFNMAAYVYFNQENYKQAAASYEKVLGTKRIPESLEQTTRYSLAKLYLIQEDYKQALTALNAWFGLVEKTGAESYILRAQIKYQLEQYSQALPDVKKAIKLVQDKGQKPRENWLLIERAVYFQNKDFIALERCLKDLIALYPKQQYWVQLSAVYNELGKSGKELSVLEGVYEQGLLKKSSQVVSLAQALLAQDIPYKSAQVLIKGIQAGVVEENAKNLSLLGDALMIAKEYDAAIDVMGKAAKADNKAKPYYKLAQIHTERQEWDQALQHVNKALDLGLVRVIKTRDKDGNEQIEKDYSKEADAYVLKGLVQFNQKQLPSAQATFIKVATYKSKEKVASQWLSYIKSEQQRLAYMQSVL